MDKVYKIIPYLIAVIGVFSVQQWIEIPISNQYLVWLVEFSLLGLFAFEGYRSRRLMTYRMPWQIVLYLSMVLLSCVYGVYMSEGYWDYKQLISNALTYLLGLGFCFFMQPSKVAYSLRIWLYVSVAVFWVLLPFMEGECPGRFFVPVAFMLIFFPFYRKNTQAILLVIVACVFVFGTLGARSNVVRFLVCGAIGVLVFLKKYISVGLLKFAILLEFLIPFIFLVLGATGIFNIFQIGDYFKGGDVEVTSSFDSEDTENLSADTRTFIYLEEAVSAVSHNYIIQGRSLARGYDSDFFGNSDVETSGRGERGSCEVSILNIFNYFGLVGVIVYLMIFLGAVLSVFKRSHNKTLYFVSVFIGFKWIWAFVEDFSNVDMNNICMWIALSMCYSPLFLKMNDRQIACWARRIINV